MGIHDRRLSIVHLAVRLLKVDIVVGRREDSEARGHVEDALLIPKMMHGENCDIIKQKRRRKKKGRKSKKKIKEEDEAAQWSYLRTHKKTSNIDRECGGRKTGSGGDIP